MIVSQTTDTITWSEHTVLNDTRRRKIAGRRMWTATSGSPDAILQGYMHQSPHRRQAEHIAQERLKEENASKWTGRLGNIRACAREVMNEEIISALDTVRSSGYTTYSAQ